MIYLKIFLFINFISWVYHRAAYHLIGYPSESFWLFLRRIKPITHSYFKLIDIAVKLTALYTLVITLIKLWQRF